MKSIGAASPAASGLDQSVARAGCGATLAPAARRGGIIAERRARERTLAGEEEAARRRLDA